VAFKTSGDGLIDPTVKMGNIPSASISINLSGLRLHRPLFVSLPKREEKKIYRQLMMSGRRALLEYIKPGYRRGKVCPVN
jgi:hypothetical protein